MKATFGVGAVSCGEDIVRLVALVSGNPLEFFAKAAWISGDARTAERVAVPEDLPEERPDIRLTREGEIVVPSDLGHWSSRSRDQCGILWGR